MRRKVGAEFSFQYSASDQGSQGGWRRSYTPYGKSTIIGEGVRRHRRYCKERYTWPITEPKVGKGQEGGSHFNDLKRRVKKPLRKARTITVPWKSDATWRMTYHQTAMGRKLTANQQYHRTAT